MPLARAMRMINALEAGTLTGPQLTSLITADPTRAAELSVMYGMRGQARRLAASNDAFTALLGSAKAVETLVANPVAMSEVKARPTAWAALQASDSALAKYLAVSAGLNPASYSSVSGVMSAVNTNGALLALMIANGGEVATWQVIKNATAMTTVDGSATLRPLVYGAFITAEGGYFGGINTVSDTRYAVVQAPKALGESASIQWKTSNAASTGTDNNDDGLANANAQNNATHPLFQWARGLVINGKSDWAPPAYNVIQMLATKLRSGTAENSLFKAGGAEVYESSQYWSATQHPSATSNAWYVNFSDGSVNPSNKDTTCRARVVRRVSL